MKVQTTGIPIVISILLLFPASMFATHIRGGFIRAIHMEATSYTYRIEVHAFTDTGSTPLFGGGELSFGDGSGSHQFEAGKPDHYEVVADEVAHEIFTVEHIFPGPGAYKISYREFNRNASIANMLNSVNTPFYIETLVIMDPYFGTNSSPEILNYFPFKSRVGEIYRYPFLASDPDGDSISIQQAIPLQDRDTPVSGYSVPGHYDGTKVISQIQIHIPDNEIIWTNPTKEDEYAYAVRIDEWRFIKEIGEWVNLGYVLYDFQLLFFDTSDGPPLIKNLTDTAILSTQDFTLNLLIEDDPDDSIRILARGNFPGPLKLSSNLDEDSYYLPPVQAELAIRNEENYFRLNPFKLALSVNSSGFYNSSANQSAMIWITDRPGNPLPPSELEVDLAFRNKIIFHWSDDSEDEAGFIVERSDSFFPEFIRIGALPANTNSFVDRNVIPNRDYYYRVKAIGTEGSSYSEILEVKEPDIITGIDQPDSIDPSFNLFPNPAGDRIFLQWENQNYVIEVTIFTTSGSILKTITLHRETRSDLFYIDIRELPPDLYFIRISSMEGSIRGKFLKK